MKYVKTYKLFESNEDDILKEIEYISYHLKDYKEDGVHFKIKVKNSYPKITDITICFDGLASYDEKISKYGVNYRPVKKEEVIEEFIEFYNRLNDVKEAEIKRVEIMWINAGEWGYNREDRGMIPAATLEMGPGKLFKNFTKTGHHNSPIENPIKGPYTLKVVPLFLEEKYDRLRNIKISVTC